ncbi:MAG: thiamine pyrophosphate-dependent dehydrogenase E1 component subunit alpha [Elusimicrobiota bacterium]
MSNSSGLSGTKNDWLKLYEDLLLARLSEEKIRSEYSKDEMKTPVHIGIGGEAIPIGVCHVLPKSIQAFGTYRNHSLYLALSKDVDGFFAELYGKMAGTGKGKAGSMHLANPEKGLIATSAVVATTIPVAVGAAFAQQYLKKDAYSVVFFGDGAVEEGVFWESINFASLKKLKVIFVCEDNELAIHSFAKGRQGFKSIKEVIAAFDIHFIQADGTRVEAVVNATEQLKLKMESDPKPGFLHLSYFRFLEHVGPMEDFPSGYRPKPTPAELDQLDPVKNFEQTLLANGIAKSDLDQIRSSVQKNIDQAVVKAQKAPFPDEKELYTDVLI